MIGVLCNVQQMSKTAEDESKRIGEAHRLRVEDLQIENESLKNRLEHLSEVRLFKG